MHRFVLSMLCAFTVASCDRPVDRAPPLDPVESREGDAAREEELMALGYLVDEPAEGSQAMEQETSPRVPTTEIPR